MRSYVGNSVGIDWFSEIVTQANGVSVGFGRGNERKEVELERIDCFEVSAKLHLI